MMLLERDWANTINSIKITSLIFTYQFKTHVYFDYFFSA